MGRRRLVGRTVGTGFGVAAVVLLLTACAAGDDGPQAVEVCGRPEAGRVVRVDDRDCDARRPGVGRYVQRLPGNGHDGDGNTLFTPMVVPNVGAPLTTYGRDPSYAFVPEQPDPARPGSTAGVGRTTRVPSVGSSSAGSTISRGGLGVSGYGSTSGG